jgi:hypothetical protein
MRPLHCLTANRVIKTSIDSLQSSHSRKPVNVLNESWFYRGQIEVFGYSIM